MSVLINKKTRLLVQGVTGNEGLFHTEQMLDYGTKVVAGTRPGKGGEWVMGTDTRLLQTAKTDIMGVVGRTTR